MHRHLHSVAFSRHVRQQQGWQYFSFVSVDAALLRSPSAAFHLLRSLMRSITEACSRRTRATQADGLAICSSSCLRSSAARSSIALSFLRRARARASNPASSSFCFFFSFTPSGGEGHTWSSGVSTNGKEGSSYKTLMNASRNSNRVITMVSSPSLAAFFCSFLKPASSFLIAWSTTASSLEPSD
jgi:hypothetical protein